MGVIPQALPATSITVEEISVSTPSCYGVPAAIASATLMTCCKRDLTKWRNAQDQDTLWRYAAGAGDRPRTGTQPENIFLDEPTTGLDPVSRVAVWEMLTEIKPARADHSDHERIIWMS